MLESGPKLGFFGEDLSATLAHPLHVGYDAQLLQHPDDPLGGVGLTLPPAMCCARSQRVVVVVPVVSTHPGPSPLEVAGEAGNRGEAPALRLGEEAPEVVARHMSD